MSLSIAAPEQAGRGLPSLSGTTTQNVGQMPLDSRFRRQLVRTELLARTLPRLARKLLLLPIAMLGGQLAHTLDNARPSPLLRPACPPCLGRRYLPVARPQFGSLGPILVP